MVANLNRGGQATLIHAVITVGRSGG